MAVYRSNTPLHLRRTPLIYVVSQIRFSAVVSISKYVPAIQEKLRQQYPWFQEGKIQEFVFQAQGTPNVSFSDRYEFLQRDKRTGVVLTSNSVALHTNKYESYELFEVEFSTALNAIHETLGIGLVERIGLRYVDLVRLGANEQWSQYLNPGLLGLEPASVGMTSMTSQYVCMGKTDAGTLAFRHTQSENPMPPDLTPVALKYDEGLLTNKEIKTVLDFDHYSEETRDFDVESVIAAIGGLHDSLDRAFRSAVTPTALKKWE